MTGTEEAIHPSELLHITIPATIVLLVFLGGLAYWLWRRKEEGLKALANAAGMTYDPDGTYDMALPAHSALYRSRFGGHDLVFTDVLRGEYHGTHIDIFKVTRCTGSGPYQRAHDYAYLVCTLHIPTLVWPPFTIRPKQWRDCVRPQLGSSLPTVCDVPWFLSKYAVQTENMDSLRQMLSGHFREWCLRHPKVTIEGDGDRLLLYKRPSMLKWNAAGPKNFEHLHRIGCEFIDIMRSKRR